MCQTNCSNGWGAKEPEWLHCVASLHSYFGWILVTLCAMEKGSVKRGQPRGLGDLMLYWSTADHNCCVCNFLDQFDMGQRLTTTERHFAMSMSPTLARTSWQDVMSFNGMLGRFASRVTDKQNKPAQSSHKYILRYYMVQYGNNSYTHLQASLVDIPALGLWAPWWKQPR